MLRVYCIGVLLFNAFVVPAVLAAQVPARCGYDACALRIDDAQLVRGRHSEPIGLLRDPRILDRLDFPDHTRPYLEDFQEAIRSAARWERAKGVFDWIGVGAGIFFLGSIPFGKTEEALDIAVPITLVTYSGGLITSQMSDRRMDRASRSLGHAVWWYNRGLRR